MSIQVKTLSPVQLYDTPGGPPLFEIPAHQARPAPSPPFETPAHQAGAPLPLISVTIDAFAAYTSHLLHLCRDDVPKHMHERAVRMPRCGETRRHVC
eukprot:362523-Chlamydomonas_euryale.AAC.6